MRHFILIYYFNPVLKIAIVFQRQRLKLPQNCTWHFPSFLHTHLCFTAGQVSESLQVRIVAGRPIHCQVPGIDHHLVKWAAVRATLEAAKAIALSHLGTLYIAETDERRINRIQQVRAQNL